MPRPKTQSDEAVLDAALTILYRDGPDALSFAGLSASIGLSPATLVQRFGSRAGLMRAALLRAWDGLGALTLRLDAELPLDEEGAVALLVGLSQDYGNIETYADGLRLLREDLRDPVLRGRGQAWRAALLAALDRRLGQPELGALLASQWQGALLWWSFDPVIPVAEAVELDLRRALGLVRG